MTRRVQFLGFPVEEPGSGCPRIIKGQSWAVRVEKGGKVNRGDQMLQTYLFLIPNIP